MGVGRGYWEVLGPLLKHVDQCVSVCPEQPGDVWLHERGCRYELGSHGVWGSKAVWPRLLGLSPGPSHLSALKL